MRSCGGNNHDVSVTISNQFNGLAPVHVPRTLEYAADAFLKSNPQAAVPLVTSPVAPVVVPVPPTPASAVETASASH